MLRTQSIQTTSTLHCEQNVVLWTYWQRSERQLEYNVRCATTTTTAITVIKCAQFWTKQGTS